MSNASKSDGSVWPGGDQSAAPPPSSAIHAMPSGNDMRRKYAPKTSASAPG